MDPSLIPLLSSILPLLKQYMPGGGGQQAPAQQAAQTGNQQALAQQAAQQAAFAQNQGMNPTQAASMPMTPQQAQAAAAAGIPASDTVGGVDPNAVGANAQSGNNLANYATAMTALNKYIDQKPQGVPPAPEARGPINSAPFTLKGIPAAGMQPMMPAGAGTGYPSSGVNAGIIQQMAQLLQEAQMR